MKYKNSDLVTEYGQDIKSKIIPNKLISYIFLKTLHLEINLNKINFRVFQNVHFSSNPVKKYFLF